jgi:cytochrome c-type biogenesis protein CcmH/NrfF
MVVSERLIETVFVWLLPAIGVVLWLWIWWAKRRDARASREEQRRRERRDAQRPPDRQPP